VLPSNGTTGVDVIGDVHGMIETYRALLSALGYARRGGKWGHPAGRRLVQLGDLVDRGPDPLGAVELTREIVESGAGDFVLGNHEVNALGWFVGAREQTAGHRKQFQSTLRQIDEDPRRWDRCADFLRSQPLKLERYGMRFVHAAWMPDAIEGLPPVLADDEGVRQTGKGGRYHGAIQDALKGPETAAPEWHDEHGIKRRKRRIRWWDAYDPAAPTVCFGHYWFTGAPHPLGPGGNAICLDYSCGRAGPLVALRWPERTFVSVRNVDATRGGFQILEDRP
jgi:hypothetical protein